MGRRRAALLERPRAPPRGWVCWGVCRDALVRARVSDRKFSESGSVRKRRFALSVVKGSYVFCAKEYVVIRHVSLVMSSRLETRRVAASIDAPLLRLRRCLRRFGNMKSVSFRIRVGALCLFSLCAPPFRPAAERLSPGGRRLNFSKTKAAANLERRALAYVRAEGGGDRTAVLPPEGIL